MSVEHRLLVRTCLDELWPDINDVAGHFYRELFRIDPGLKAVLPGNDVFLRRKFFNMLGVFKNVKHLEKIAPTVRNLAVRHLNSYGVQTAHFESVKQGLLAALQEYFAGRFTQDRREAWNIVYDEVADLMCDVIREAAQPEARPAAYDADAYDPSLLEAIGGEGVVLRVHVRFYDVIFEDPWLGQFFGGKHRDVLREKQTQFMVAAFGGPNRYVGDTPAFVHMHMYITEEMSDLRERMLRQAILDEGLSEEIADRWLKVDRAFRHGIVKKSVDECVMKCPGQRPIVAHRPAAGAADAQRAQRTWTR